MSIYLIRLRRDTEANWNSANPVLALGEAGVDVTNNEMKFGDGVTAWNDLLPAVRANVDGGRITSAPTVGGVNDFNFLTTEGYSPNATIVF